MSVCVHVCGSVNYIYLRVWNIQMITATAQREHSTASINVPREIRNLFHQHQSCYKIIDLIQMLN